MSPSNVDCLPITPKLSNIGRCKHCVGRWWSLVFKHWIAVMNRVIFHNLRCMGKIDIVFLNIFYDIRPGGEITSLMWKARTGRCKHSVPCGKWKAWIGRYEHFVPCWLDLSALDYRVLNTVALCTFMILNPVGKSRHEREKRELDMGTLCSLLMEHRISALEYQVKNTVTLYTFII